MGAAAFVLVMSQGFAADNPSPAEKAKPIDTVAKPAIAKPSDALVPKAKEASKLETSPLSKQPLSSGAQMPSPAAEVAPAAAQTPSGRPITDLRVMPASGSASKANSGAVPAAASAASGSTNASSQAPAADPLEEKVRSLLQDRLGKDGEVVLRVSPDTPIAKQDRVATNAAAKSRSEVVAPLESKTEPQKSGDGITPIKRSAGITATGNDVHPWDWRGLVALRPGVGLTPPTLPAQAGSYNLLRLFRKLRSYPHLGLVSPNCTGNLRVSDGPARGHYGLQISTQDQVQYSAGKLIHLKLFSSGFQASHSSARRLQQHPFICSTVLTYDC
jgi:hypothetical protein